ncbi:15528_t:CDS:1, partial [Dentiscutata erythropus]
DAKGSLILANRITYAIHKEKVSEIIAIIDIAIAVLGENLTA